MFCGGALEHVGFGFATGADDFFAIFGVMGAVVDGVEGCVLGGQLTFEFGVDFCEAFFGEEASGNGRLVGDDDDGITGGVEFGNGFVCVGNQLQVFNAV